MISLLFIVFATFQLPISLEPIDQFQWRLLIKVALQMMYTINQKNENWIWLTENSFCSITSRMYDDTIT